MLSVLLSAVAALIESFVDMYVPEDIRLASDKGEMEGLLGS